MNYQPENCNIHLSVEIPKPRKGFVSHIRSRKLFMLRHFWQWTHATDLRPCKTAPDPSLRKTAYGDD